MRAFSFGGGVQSTAVLVLAARGLAPYRTFLFANVGEDSENPKTLLYVRHVAQPYAVHHGLSIVHVRRKGPTLLEMLESERSDIPAPVFFAGGLISRRNCTTKWKIEPLAANGKADGATAAKPVQLGIGISVDEWQRAKDSRIAWEVHEFPLLDLRLTRTDCRNIIVSAGLPMPPKSSCWFCPMHSMADWQRMAVDEPEQFERAAALEERLTAKRAARGLDAVYLSRRAIPLRQAVAVTQTGFDFDDGGCDSGYCMT